MWTSGEVSLFRPSDARPIGNVGWPGGAGFLFLQESGSARIQAKSILSDCTEKESSGDALSPPSSCCCCFCRACCWFVARERTECRPAGYRAHCNDRGGVDRGSERRHPAARESGDDLPSERLSDDLGADRQEGSKLPAQCGGKP